MLELILFALGLVILVKGADFLVEGASSMWLAILVLFTSIFIWKRHSIGKKEGLIMFIGYIAYTVFLIARG